MRASVQAAASVKSADWRPTTGFSIECVDVRCGIKKTFGAQEKASSRPFVERQPQGLHQRIDRVIALRRIVSKIAISSVASESVVSRNRFEKGRLAWAVLAREEADASLKHHFFQRTNRRDREGVDLPILDPLVQEPEFLQHGSILREPAGQAAEGSSSKRHRLEGISRTTGSRALPRFFPAPVHCSSKPTDGRLAVHLDQ